MRDRTPAGGNGDEYNHGKGWRKSSYSMSNGQCLEINRLAGARIGVRDSKAAEGPVLSFALGAWTTFLSELRSSPSSKS
jgi:hypothetical protein